MQDLLSNMHHTFKRKLEVKKRNDARVIPEIARQPLHLTGLN
jgi:hypothetical protein